MEDLRLEVHYWHLLGVFGWNGQPELEYCILVDSLLDEVDTLPVGERGHRIVWVGLSRHQKHSNWGVLLE